MKTTRLGCLSLSGLFTAIFTLAIITGVSLAQGGVLFSPGELNAVQGDVPVGGVVSHAEISGRCGACHTAIWDHKTMADRCLDCHSQDLLKNEQDFHIIMMGQSKKLGCLSCHTDHHGPDAKLTLLEMDRFPHNDTAGFSLKAHQRKTNGELFTCADCHGAKIARFQQITCQSCHMILEPLTIQAHFTTFGADCLACHDGEDTYGYDFNHNQTEFILIGRHISIDCSDCHTGARTRIDLQTTPQDCLGCHNADDPHSGSFGADCSTCHTPQDWEDITFDHSQTDFPLAGKHAIVQCQECHQTERLTATPQDCFGCHAKDDDHNGQLGQDCAACHTPTAWEEATFDHSLAAFPLTGAHISVSCTQCHLDGSYSGTPQLCYACHAEQDQHNGQFGTVCESCHTTESWGEVNFDHSLSNFPLTGAHVSIACVQCHDNGQFRGTPQACAACHSDPQYHRGLFSANCASCHNTSAWIPAQFNGAHRFPMNHGARGNSSCQTCHPSTLRSYSCYGCHEHNRNNIEREHREEGIGNLNNCVRCHPTGREEGDGRDGDD